MNINFKILTKSCSYRFVKDWLHRCMEIFLLMSGGGVAFNEKKVANGESCYFILETKNMIKIML